VVAGEAHRSYDIGNATAADDQAGTAIDHFVPDRPRGVVVLCGGVEQTPAQPRGAMGYSVPAAIGAKIAYPDRMVVSLVSAGGFLMTGQELATAFHHGIAPIVLVFNNQLYGTIRMHQERAYPGRVSGTALSNPDFVKLIEAFGGHGEEW
jgi:TPP-dependent 2-oxoacid decarboxylase